MSSHYLWYALAAALVAGEIATGTLWLAALAVGFFAGGAVEQLAGDWRWAVTACVASAVLCGVLVWWHRRGQRLAPVMDSDIGQTVTFVAPGNGPGMVRVAYRGSTWDARIVAGPERPSDNAPGRIEGRASNLLLVSF